MVTVYSVESCSSSGRFTDDVGPCSISSGEYLMSSGGDTRQSVLPGVRLGGDYVVQTDLTVRNGASAGLIVNYQDPENFGVVAFALAGSNAIIYYQEFEDGQVLATRGQRIDLYRDGQL